MFENRHYIFLAHWLCQLGVDDETQAKIARDLASKLKSQSGKFNETKFLKEAGVES